MKKLFRPLLVMACLAVLSVAAFAAVSPVLEKQVEDLVRNTLLANDCTVKEVKFNSSGTLVLSEIATTIKTGLNKGSVTISEVGIDIPLALMPVLIQPDVMLPKAGPVELASRITVKDLVHSSTVAVSGKQMTSTSKTSNINIDKLRVEAASLRKILAGDNEPSTFISFVYGIEVDSFEALDTTGDIPEEQTTYKVAKNSGKGLKKAGYEEVTASGIQVIDLGAKVVIDLESISSRGLQLPPEATTQALIAMIAKDQDPQNLLIQILTDPAPMAREIHLGRISIKEKASKVATVESVVYTADNNWKKNLSINGLAIPPAQLKDLGDVSVFLAGINELQLDSTFAMHTEDNNLKLKTSYKSPQLGEITLSGTYMGDLGKSIVEMIKNPMVGLGYKFKDLKLVIEDKSLLARSMAALGTTPEMAPAMVEGMLMQIFEKPSQDTSKLVQSIREFANKPGTLEVFTKPGMEMVAAGFIAVAANPGAVFSASSTQGSQLLGDQIRALPIAGAPGK